jgi:hypothetical protein
MLCRAPSHSIASADVVSRVPHANFLRIDLPIPACQIEAIQSMSPNDRGTQLKVPRLPALDLQTFERFSCEKSNSDPLVSREVYVEMLMSSAQL